MTATMGASVPEPVAAAEVAAPAVAVAAPLTELMIDTIHANVGNVPVSTPKVAGYDTGSEIIQWTDADWARFPNSDHIIINQAPDPFNPLLGYVYDSEDGAITIAQAVAGCVVRKAHGRELNVYISADSASNLCGALAAASVGDVNLWLANWNLSQEEATALVGTKLTATGPNGSYSYPVVAVQWASPTSNPDTIVPGSSETLSEANVDLSVALASWYKRSTPVVTPPPVVAPATIVPTVDDIKTAYETGRAADEVGRLFRDGSWYKVMLVKS